MLYIIKLHMSESVFRGTIEFFHEIGIYDVILPFLLIFAIVFAILEKTKVFGTEKIGKDVVTRRNINSLVAFVIAFLTIASSKLVETITTVSSYMVILLLLSIFFLILVGSFFKEGEGVFLESPWKEIFMAIMFVGIIGIFLYAIQTADGTPWLYAAWDYLSLHWGSRAVASIILLIVVVLFMYFTVKTPGKKVKKEEKND